jgi:hypothetical protein
MNMKKIIKEEIGDYGWGFSWVSRAHTFSKMVRNQIFRKVIKDIES